MKKSNQIIYNPNLLKAVKKRRTRLSCRDLFNCNPNIDFGRTKRNAFGDIMAGCANVAYSESVFYTTDYADQWRRKHDTEETVLDKNKDDDSFKFRKSHVPADAETSIVSHWQEVCDRLEGNIYIIGSDTLQMLMERSDMYRDDLLDMDDMEQYVVDMFRGHKMSILVLAIVYSYIDGTYGTIQDGLLFDIGDDYMDFMYLWSDGRVHADFRSDDGDHSDRDHADDDSEGCSRDTAAMYNGRSLAILSMLEYLEAYSKEVKPGDIMFRNGLKPVVNGTGMTIKYCE